VFDVTRYGWEELLWTKDVSRGMAKQSLDAERRAGGAVGRLSRGTARSRSHPGGTPREPAGPVQQCSGYAAAQIASAVFPKVNLNLHCRCLCGFKVYP